MMDNAAIAKALFAALEGQDDQGVRDLCALNLRVRQNNSAPMGLDALLKFNRAVHGVVKGFCYADAVRSATATGFVEEHAVGGVLDNGEAINLAVCIVGDVREGKVIEVREYLDTAAASSLVAALR